MKAPMIAVTIALATLATSSQAQLTSRAPFASGAIAVNPSGPLPCGQSDDGTTENALGLVAGGEIGWLHGFDCIDDTSITAVQTAYGTAMFPGSVTNGSTSRLAVYECATLDPTSAMTLEASQVSVVVNGDTDILNTIPLATSVDRTGGHCTFVIETADHVAGQFPGPMDQDNPSPNAWVVGSTLGPGSLDLANLNNNDVPPTNMAAIGFPTAWLLRVDTGDPPSTGTPICFGDGTGTACPCLNNGSPGTGCANGTGSGGVLHASGAASVSNDTMSLTANGVVNNNGLFFQGNNTIGGGTGGMFGDGIRCCGGSVVRIQVVNPPGTTSPATAQMTETATTNGPNGTIVAGGKKCYQYWYRDPATSPCGAQFNLTNAVTVTWQP